MCSPNSKKASWLSKLRRPPIRKEQRVGFWTTVITLIIFSPILIIITLALTVPSASQPPEVMFNFLIVRIIGIDAGILMLLFASWLAINELYVMWESQKQIITNRETTYLNLIKKFDRTFKAVQEESDPDLKADALGDFQDQLHTLCYNYEWNKVKDRIEKVLDCIIPEKLFNEPHAKRYIQFLAIIINRFGEHVIDAISKKWLKEIDKFYDDPNYDTTSISNVLYILLQLRGYSKDYVTELIDDATTRWSELRSQMLEGDLGLAFDELKKRDESSHEEIISYLRRKKRDAKQDKDERAYERLDKMFRRANK